uniref:asparaginase n=1 Tax=Heterorhabditis bacteriophora TaxID=37862 RepID=A0A1I7XUA2_HETBA
MILKMSGSPTWSTQNQRKTPLDESHTPKLLKVHDGSLMRNISATNLVHELNDSKIGVQNIDGPTPLPESRVLVLYTGGTIGMLSKDGGIYSVNFFLHLSYLIVIKVCVYFNNKLMRGNRTIKLDNSALEAFDSPNMLPLAKMAINIKVNYSSIFRSNNIEAFAVHDNLCRDVGLLRIFPSMSIESVRAFLQPPTKGVILQTFGAGNMPTKRLDIIEAIKDAIIRGCLIVNCSQCLKGQVDVNYATGKILYDIGVIPGSDMTSESAMAKLCYVLGKEEWDLDIKRMMLQSNLRGEMTVTNKGAIRELDIIPHIAKCMRISSDSEVQLLRETILPPLFCNAAKNNNALLLESLKESGAHFSNPDYNLRTALHVAASNGNLDAVNYLLSIGVNVHMKDVFGYNPIVCAVKAKALPCVKAIRKAGGLIDAPQHRIGVELCLAAARGDIDLLKCYEAGGCTLKEADYDGRTALHVAVAHNHIEIVRYLMEAGLDPNALDEFGTTPFSEAIKKKLKDVEEELYLGLSRRDHHNDIFSMDDH